MEIRWPVDTDVEIIFNLAPLDKLSIICYLLLGMMEWVVSWTMGGRNDVQICGGVEVE